MVYLRIEGEARRLEAVDDMENCTRKERYEIFTEACAMLDDIE